MAHSKLHIICGNCGCNNMWEIMYDHHALDIDGKLYADTYLICKNCSTMHSMYEHIASKGNHSGRTIK